jgi:RNA polymerase sigma factor (sigma-70 family)
MRNHSPSDPDLLDEWLRHQREPAFHALVSRYAGLVHATARRTCGDESMAAEVSQLTFITLARKARSLVSCVSLGGWLHRTAMMHAKNLIRQTHREKRKCQQLAMETPSHPHHDTWREMQPVLDDALAALSDKDREALLLRFYRSLTVREVAATLGIATDAAQKRIDRATERLRSKLLRRSVQSGGTLAATLLAGFSADAQAALPVSILASKAIAGAGSIGSLTLLFSSIATLMKTSTWITPTIVLLVAGVWTGTKYQSLATLERGNASLREKINLAQQTQQPSMAVKSQNDDGAINWQKLATEPDNGPEKSRFLKRLEMMNREEMIAVLGQISSFDCPTGRRTVLESPVINRLSKIDPEWVLDHYAERLREKGLGLDWAWAIWARKDLAAATAWLDAQIAAGRLDSIGLDENRGSEARSRFESRLIAYLLDSDPTAVSRRLGALPETQRESVVSSLGNGMADRLLNQPAGSNHLAFANLVRSHIPAERQTEVLSKCMDYMWGVDEFPKFTAYMDAIEATPEERISCAEKFSGHYIRMLSNKRKVTLDDLEKLRGHFAEISPERVDALTAGSLAEAVKGRHSSMMFPQASELAVALLKATGNDSVLAQLLETANFDKADKDLGKQLAAKVRDESRRAAILKRFE